jgi:squalene synthase HpnC
MPVDHYENFPVASILMPARLRPAVEAVYAFARSADDIADEGLATSEERLQGLAGYRVELDLIGNGVQSTTPLFERIAKTVITHRLPLQPFYDLLSAFSQDVVTKRYATFADLLDYCRRSANPVGTLMLHLYEVTDAQAFRQSDAICSALQLINFWQDVAVDWEKQRVYLPQEDLIRFGVNEEDIASGNTGEPWRKLMQFEIDRARAMMLEGAPLALRLPGRIGWELRLVVQGGLRILERIEAAEGDVFRRRPKLGMWDWMCMAWRAVCMKIRLSPRTQLG